MATLSELLGKLSDDNQIRGHQFEHICKWYLQNAPQYRLLLGKVWLWDEWPDRWGPDAGIDLVARTYDDKLWAVQAKAYAPTHHITKADVDTFLSESSREVFSYRLLIATTNFIGHTAERTLDAQEKAVGKILLSDLRKSEVVWPESPERLEAKPPERKKPRPHQRKAVSEVCEGFARNNRGQLIMASGTGKTLVSLWIAEKLQSQRTLILLPSLSLLGQTLREWTANASQPFHYLPVCSDDTVRGADRLISKTSDLGLPATTDSNEVAEFLEKEGNLIVFSTYQSSSVIAEAFERDNVPPFSLAVADEAHRCAGSVSSPFATILDVGGIQTQRRLFMTATPRFFTDRVREEAKEIEYEIASMDDKDKFGPIFHKLPYSEAIQQDLLSDYRVVIIGVDDPTYREYAEQGTFVTTDGENITDARILASQIAVGKAMQKYNLRRIISFHSRIKRAKEFSERFPEVVNWMPEENRPEGRIWSKHVSGLMSAGQRDVLLDCFRDLEVDERGLLANARCLGEGVDVPSLDGVAFIDPRSSQLDIIQAVGRAIRKAPEKTIGTIVLPVFIDPEQDPETALSESDFKPVWNVLKALRAHDEVLGEVLDKLRRQLGRECSTEIDIPEKLAIDLPITVDESFVRALRLKAIERSTASWEFWYGLLEQYVEREGHAMVPSKYVTDEGHSLGSWVQTQRKAHRKGKLYLEQERLLERLPAWKWGTGLTRRDWEVWYEHLQAYVALKGHAKVPVSYVTKDGLRLGVWAFTQRIAHQKGKLSSKRCRLLQQLPGWRWGVNIEWTLALDSLRKYAERFGHTAVSHNYVTESGFPLGKWFTLQLKRYLDRSMSDDQLKALKSIPGWTWDFSGARAVEDWVSGLDSLRKYIDSNGHTNVSHNYVTDGGFPLGKWIAKQRRLYMNEKIPVDHKQALEQIPEWKWDSSGLSWQEGIELLREYAEREGHTKVPQRYIDADVKKLGRWVSAQRHLLRYGKMPIERQQEIEKIPGWTCDPDWDKGMKHLRTYILRRNHAKVPEDYVTRDFFQLGKWVRLQREYWTKGILLPCERKQLEHFPVWSESCIELGGKLPHWLKGEPETWGIGFRLLRRYSDHEGHTFVPRYHLTDEGYYLGEWVNQQRLPHSKRKLSSRQRRRLEKLPNWVWDVSQIEWIVEEEDIKEGFWLLGKCVDQVGIARVRWSLFYDVKDRWVNQCRLKYRGGGLSPKAIWLLENLPNWTWDLR